jgi:hypothetical protein
MTKKAHTVFLTTEFDISPESRPLVCTQNVSAGAAPTPPLIRAWEPEPLIA